MADVTYKRGDNAPPITATLSDLDGPIDLSSADAVRLRMKSDTAIVEAGPVEITDAANGEIKYEWEADDLMFAGSYRGEWEITWSDGTIQTVPNDTYFAVDVLEDLG